MRFEERPSVFRCGESRLIAIISRPQEPLPRGVLVVVGGPQYRAGSHRQFTLLCRALAGRGVTAMRFDYRGMGDSQGEPRIFEEVLPDIHAAVAHFCAQVPELREIAIWGLCDAASAALFCAHQDPRISGLVLLNPWVRTPVGMAKAQLRHYYWSRFVGKALWSKVMRGEFDFAAALRSFARAVATAFGRKRRSAEAADPQSDSGRAPDTAGASLPDRMAEGLGRFKGRVLLILSGDDLTAQEFVGIAGASRRWRRLLAEGRIERRDLPAANHTFSRREWRDQVAVWTAQWLDAG